MSGIGPRLRLFFVDPRDPLRQQHLTIELRGQGDGLTQRQLRGMAYDVLPSGCKLQRYEVLWK